ncbi:hypothetical protein ASPCAL08508 [Aspergillus calidoustus]|uniref:Fungal STAND N-terminal Goodbye domain-containing protein n=1 Tax=Aspergillus calidoustus TaxID=454130 RepID=A0A0U5GSY5_ASPCI|nr:hypothetical protein ASPCAL08508 [Aspergillus calidoustus]
MDLDTTKANDSGQTDVVRFMRGLDGRDHPALDTRVRTGVAYDTNTKRWTRTLKANSSASDDDLNEIYKDCFAARDSFLEIVDNYRLKHGQQPIQHNLSHDWKDVETTMTQACDVLDGLAASDQDVQGFTGKIRRAFRALCRNAKDAKVFIAFIPSNFAFSAALCAGLQTLFTAMEQAGYHRGVVYRTLERLPVILNDRAVSLENLPEDEEIHRRMANLYEATLKTLQIILKWFYKNSLKSGLRALVKPSEQSDKLNDCLEEVKWWAEQVKERALFLSQKLGDQSLQLQYETVYLQQAAIDMQNHVGGDVQEVLRRLEALNDLATVLVDTANQISTRVQQSRPHKAAPRIRSRPVTPSGVVEELLKRFEYDASLIPQDCTNLLKLNPDKDDLDEDKLMAMIQSPRLRSWLAIDESSTLLINGQGRPTPKSEVSYTAAKLAESLIRIAAEQPNIVALAYFCGQHQRLSDVYASPSELIMSLLLQLIDGYRGFLQGELERCLQDVDPRHVVSLCQAFHRLVERLPNDIFLYVVVDGLSFFTDPADRREQTATIIHQLVGLHAESTKATVKLLFTCPTRASFVEDIFEEEEIVNLPRNPKPSQWSQSRWKNFLVHR